MDRLYNWYANGEHGHVAAYLRTLYLSGFDPKARPRKTVAFWDSVDASRAPEEAELADAQASLGRPSVVTWPCLAEHAAADLAVWLRPCNPDAVIPNRHERQLRLLQAWTFGRLAL